MRNRFFLNVLLLLLVSSAYHVDAQDKHDRVFNRQAPGNEIFHQVTSTGYSGTGANIDVIYHRANWSVEPNTVSNFISGTVTTRFKTIEPNVSTVNFDFNEASFSNSSLSVTILPCPLRLRQLAPSIP
jgi:hypothetical protein